MHRFPVVAVLAALVLPATADAAPQPLGLTCTAQSGVRFCPAETPAQRVPSFDGTPLDADVTLPAEGDGPWPTIVLLNGLGGHKRQLEPEAPSPGNGRGPKIFPDTTHYSNVWYARRGYAVLAASSRGFGESCGAGGAPAAQLQTGACARGFVRIADQRYEARDTQHLLGLLVDEGIAKPGALGATGFSYGGGQAVTLGYLGGRIRCGASVPAGDPCAGRPNGAYVPWTSPKGVPLAMTAIYGQWLWSDLIASLLPNGRFLDDDPATGDDSTSPLGVLAQSYTNGLFGLADLDGYVVAPQLPGSPDAPWDLTTIVAKLNLGDPYGEDVRAIAREFAEFHDGFGTPGPHAAMLLESGWNDDVFPPAESLRAYQDLRSRDPHADVALLLGDYGHARAANTKRVAVAFNDAASAFFDEHLRGVGRGPGPGSVTSYLSTCGGDAQAARPLTAPTWPAIHRRAVTIRGGAAQTVDSGGGDPLVGLQFDPIPNTNPLGTGDPCKAIADGTAPGTATYATRSAGFTMLGLPTISATVTSTGAGGQLAARLWDVADGRRRLVTRGVYRLTDGQTGRIRFQLHGNGYRFAPGHTARLEIAPSDAPQYRFSNQAFTARLEDVTVSLPLATPCSATRRLRVPRLRGVRSVTVRRGTTRLVTLRGRAARARTVTVDRLAPGRARLTITVRSATRTVSRSSTVRVCR